ncbi:MAG: hypothetical protein ACREEM_40040 [Blastocatellia bacterium]
MSKPILKPDRKYTFSDYFDLNNPPEEIVAELGYLLRSEILQLPTRAADEAVVAEMQAFYYDTLPHIALNSEIAKREFLVAPVLREVVRRTRTPLATDYPIEINNKLSGSLDYLLRAAHKLVVIGAKKSDLDKGFNQLAAEMIALDQYYEHDDPAAELYGAVTVGELWRFAVLRRPDKLLLRDLGAYRVPEDLNDLLSILFGILQPAAVESP